MATLELPSTPADIDHAMAVEVMEDEWEHSGWYWHEGKQTRRVSLYTPSTDLNQAVEGARHICRDRGCFAITRHRDGSYSAWVSPNIKTHAVNAVTPATALCLALIAAVRGEG